LKLDLTLAGLMVMAIGIVLTLGYLATNVGSQWTAVQSGIATLFVLIMLFVVCIIFAVKS